MFSDLFKGSLQNLVLATTFWSCLSRTANIQQMGEKREEELVSTDKFWGSKVRQGAQIRRTPDTRQGCLSLVLDIIAHSRSRLSRSEAPVEPSIAPSERRTCAAEDIERVRTEHERQKQEYIEQFEAYIAEDLQRRLTLENEQRRQSEHQIQSAQERGHCYLPNAAARHGSCHGGGSTD
ncbi:uncharacterized protein A1O5_04085 [Cladophialophora psammophila CBS 110553]|uniref:Uncharacterized protein n=1 Tax=Cladophialophora psammophila CBS 110553 TaxID=1182543 RepID=W9X7Q1_9EURO|nr:uncharacterized protein A1O5_04085 [Cladophialophora psammophila CBS 110553]EXJ72936.1 hypothetical protein A1O5_04085 [Cladophialophora psammophila CBS 110553]